MKFIGRIFKFLWLLFWVYPIKKEENAKIKRENGEFVACFFGLLLGYLLIGHPIIAEKNYPLLENTIFAEGIIVRKSINDRGGKYKSEPFGIKMGNSVIYKECARLGVSCFENAEWNSLVGKTAKIWYWDNHIIKIEIAGKNIHNMSYEKIKERYTDNTIQTVLLSLLFIAFIWHLIRCYSLYFKALNTIYFIRK